MDIDRYTLHRARVSAGLSLEELARRTRISPGLLKLIDDGKFERLPGGIYARSYVRAVAKIVGIDGEEAVRALSPLMRDGALGTPAEDEVAASAAPDGKKRDETRTEPEAPATQAFAAWLGRDDDWRRWGASAIDGLVLVSVWGLLWGIARASAGPLASGAVSVSAVTVAAGLLAAMYFLVFAGLGGSTPGDQLLKVSPEEPQGPIVGTTIGRRAKSSFLVKASIIVDAIYTTEWALDALRMKSVE